LAGGRTPACIGQIAGGTPALRDFSAQRQRSEGLGGADIGNVVIGVAEQGFHPPAAADALGLLQPGDAALDARVAGGRAGLAQQHNRIRCHVRVTCGVRSVGFGLDHGDDFGIHRFVPLHELGHEARGPSTVRLLLAPQHRDGAVAFGWGDELGHEGGELEFRGEFVVVDRLMLLEPGFDAVDALERVCILHRFEPAGSGGHGACGLHGEFEIRGDIGDFDLVDGLEEAFGRGELQRLAQGFVGVIGEFFQDVLVPTGEAEAAPDGLDAAAAAFLGAFHEVFEDLFAGLAEKRGQG